MSRALDVILSLFLLIFLMLPCLLIWLAVRWTSEGPGLYWSDRVGRHNRVFRMPKFRTMRINTPTLATHLLQKPERHLTPIGGFLRRTSLDELPQIWSILKGDMSFVGPRPALYNQQDLISLRTGNGIQKLRPGLTGWAQINGRDELSVEEKVRLDLEYKNKRTVLFDVKILFLTVLRVLQSRGVVH